MKILFSLLLLLLPAASLAQTAPVKPLNPSNVQVIDGKKFFSLANVRRQEGTGLSPSALAVINNPRTDLRIAPAGRLAMTPVSGSSTTPTIENTAGALPWAKPVAPSSPALTGAAAQKADLLSIFAPEDRPAPARSAPVRNAVTPPTTK